MRVARYRKENILSERVELLRRMQELVSSLGRLEKNILSKMGERGLSDHCGPKYADTSGEKEYIEEAVQLIKKL